MELHMRFHVAVCKVRSYYGVMTCAQPNTHYLNRFWRLSTIPPGKGQQAQYLTLKQATTTFCHMNSSTSTTFIP